MCVRLRRTGTGIKEIALAASGEGAISHGHGHWHCLLAMFDLADNPSLIRMNYLSASSGKL
jgi:hypothetical protein